MIVVVHHLTKLLIRRSFLGVVILGNVEHVLIGMLWTLLAVLSVIIVIQV